MSEALSAMGIAADDMPGGFVRIPNYVVHLGRHKGEKVDIAVVGVDFPLTPPAGVHINAPWGADRLNISASPLGGNWRYFSRRHPNWSGRNLTHVLVAYLNKVLGDA